MNNVPFLIKFDFELILFLLLPASLGLGQAILDGGAGLKHDIFHGCGGFSLDFGWFNGLDGTGINF